jgi:hypothetical protein
MLLNTPNTMAVKTHTQLMVATQHTSNTTNNTWQQRLHKLNNLHRAARLQDLLRLHLLAKHLLHHLLVLLQALADTML